MVVGVPELPTKIIVKITTTIPISIIVAIRGLIPLVFQK